MFSTFDPFRELTAVTPALDYDIVRSDEGVELYIDIPGVDPAHVDLTVDGRSLHLKAERRLEVPEGSTLVSRRRRPSEIAKTFQLGANLDAERLEADYAFGVLKVAIPVAESAKPRKIEVGMGGNAIDAALVDTN